MKRHLMRLLSILLILSLVLGSGQTVQTSYAATSGVCGDKLTWVLDSGTLTISGTGSMDDYQSSSDQPWYKEGVSKDIKTVVIEGGVTSIGKFAFYDCTSLESVRIPEGVISIGKFAFHQCEKLESVTIPNSVTSIEAGAFRGCNGLTEVTILSWSTTIDGSAFTDDNNINDVFFAGNSDQWNIISGAFPSNTSIHYCVFVDIDYDKAVGTVDGSGMYEDDDGKDLEKTDITLNATPKEGYAFVGWEKDGQIIFTGEDWAFPYDDVCDHENGNYHYYLKLKAVFKKALTITVKDQTHTYDGDPQGEADPPYNDPAVIKEKVTVKGLLDGDQVTSIVLAGTKTEVGEYKDAIEITGFTINDDSDAVNKYAVTTVPGKLTIKAPDPTVYEITATENISTWGTVSGGGTYNESDSVTLKAVPNDGYVFDCWTEGGTRVDGAGAEYTFTASCARNLVANFREIVVREVNIENTTYTGEPAVQDFSRANVELRSVDVTLQEGTDYKFVYENNVDAGTATVRLDFIKDFTGSKSFPFVIQPKPVTIAAGDEAFTYDGEAQSNAGYTVEGLCGDDAVTAVVTGSITFPSESPVVNKIESYEFTSGKADNYDVTTADGQLTMQKASVEITLTAGSGEWTYDGEAHGTTEVTVTSGILFPGDELVASASGSVTDVADSAEGNNPVV